MDQDPLVAQCRSRTGQVISGKWRLDALIGVGGMAAVYMATHRNGSIAAVKILHEEVARNEEVRERFLREAYIANKVNHEGTVKVLDDDIDEKGAPFLVMELLQGDSVEAAAEKQGGTLGIDETLDILDQTLAVLESAHAAGIVHRDLKPENLFLTKGRIKVLDFGIARLREENARKTQTGMVMGTPSFMAPEQAMGRWDEVDARTDLWAMGATAFTLLAGVAVHEAETAGEMLVAAATRPARSLARVVQNAPFPLVALIDRALAYDRNNRFPNATAFRKELAEVRASVSGKVVAPVEAPAQGLVIPPTVVGASAPELDERERRQKVDSYDVSMSTPQEIAAMREFFMLLERGLVATKQYAPNHPEVKRRFDVAFRELASGLMTCDICLAWNLTPYAFVCGDEVVWEPEVPWNRIPYQLFSDGVRSMGLVPGLDEVEFAKFLELISIDPTLDLAPEDDLVTRLWDAGFMNVFHQAIDSFAEGTQEERARYEAERAAIIDNAHVDHRAGLDDAWNAAHGQGTDAKDRSAEVLGFLNKNQPMDAEAAARARNLNVMDPNADDAAAAEAIHLDEATRALLAARLDVDVGATSQRFVVAAAEAFVVSAKMGRSAAVTAPLRRAVDGLSAGEPEKAMDMILELRETVKVEGKQAETDSLREIITAEVLSPATLLDILKGSKTLPEERRKEYLAGLSKVLECIQGQHFDAALNHLKDAPDAKIRQLLFDFIERTLNGQEAKIAALFPDLDVDMGLEMVRLLAKLGTEAARDAISHAVESPHALVRIEALGHVEGVSGVRIRHELAQLLSDDQALVRMAALRAMRDHNIAAAGPFLVMRIQDAGFAKLPYEERQQSLDTLSRLRPKRAEELCIEILEESRLIKSESFSSTQEIAAIALGDLASGDRAMTLLEGLAASSTWRTGKRVRDAAERAIARVNERVADAQRRAEDRRSRIAAGRTQQGERGKSNPPPAERRTQPGEPGKTKPGEPGKRKQARPASGAGGDDGTDGGEGRTPSPNRRPRAGGER
jgi:hypothetical protein